MFSGVAWHDLLERRLLPPLPRHTCRRSGSQSHAALRPSNVMEVSLYPGEVEVSRKTNNRPCFACLCRGVVCLEAYHASLNKEGGEGGRGSPTACQPPTPVATGPLVWRFLVAGTPRDLLYQPSNGLPVYQESMCVRPSANMYQVQFIRSSCSAASTLLKI